MPVLEWVKSPPELIDLWDEVVPLAPGVDRRNMFGYPAVFTNGNMFAGLHRSSLVLRLPEPEMAEFLAQAGAKPFEPMPGRLMRGFVVAPAALLQDKPALRRWLERALEAASKMPPKESKPRRTKQS